MGKRVKKSQLVRLFVIHWTVGFLLSAAFVGALLYFNFGGLGHLMLKEPITIFMLWFFAGSTFAGAQTAMTVMSLTDEDDDQGGKRAPEASDSTMVLKAAPVAAPRR